MAVHPLMAAQEAPTQCNQFYKSETKLAHTCEKKLITHVAVLLMIQYLFIFTSRTFTYALFAVSLFWTALPYLAAWLYQVKHPAALKAYLIEHPYFSSFSTIFWRRFSLPKAFILLHYVFVKQISTKSTLRGFKMIMSHPLLLHIMYEAVVVLTACSVWLARSMDAFSHPCSFQDPSAVCTLVYVHHATLMCATGTMIFYAFSVGWRPSDETVAEHERRVASLSDLWPDAAQLRSEALVASDVAAYEAHEAFVHLSSTPLSIWSALLVVAGWVATFLEHGWPQLQVTEVLVASFLAAVAFLMVLILHLNVASDYTRAARSAIFLMKFLTHKLREWAWTPDAALSASLSETRPDEDAHNRAAQLISSWLRARMFLQREDVNLFFGSVSGMVAALIVVAFSCALVILVHLFDLIELDVVTLAALGAITVWTICASYFMAYFAIQLSVETHEQLKLLEYYRLARWTSSTDSRESETSYFGYIASVAAFVEKYDEPPKVMGIRVDPNLLYFLNRSVASVLTAAVAGLISNALRQGHGVD